MEEKDFISKDVFIKLRCTPFLKKKMRERASKLGISLSEYIRKLSAEDLKNGIEKGAKI